MTRTNGLAVLISVTVVLVCLCPAFTAVGVSYSSTDVPKAIPDGYGWHVGASSIIEITDEGVVSDVNVTVNVDHGNGQQLKLELIGPSGAVAVLSDDCTSGYDYPGTTFDDQATTPIWSAPTPYTGTYPTSGMGWGAGLAQFNGGSLAGTWTLRVIDRFDGITGTIEGWSLTIVAGEASGPAPTVALNPPSPDTLWPPNGKQKSVTISGSVVDAGGGVGAAWLTVVDEYDEYGSSVPVTVVDGIFSATVSLVAARFEDDMDGRCYTITLHAENTDGSKEATTSVSVIVPHDLRR